MELKGRLLYMGWFNTPWKFISEGSEIDLWQVFENYFNSLHGKPATLIMSETSFILPEEEGSRYRFEYTPGEKVCLVTSEKDILNVFPHLNDVLRALTGRLVRITVEEGKKLAIAPDPTEQVFKVPRENGNSGELPKGTEKTICKVSTPECCIFLSLATSGFCCEKFHPKLAGLMLARLAKGETNAKRIGNCALSST